MAPAWVSGFIGLPYVPGGRQRTGLDCWGLYALVWAEQFGRPLPPYDGPEWRRGADPVAVGKAALVHAETAFSPVMAEDAALGDAILLRVRGAPIHVGMWVAPGHMLHIEAGCGSIMERFDGTAWRNRVVGFWRRL